MVWTVKTKTSVKSIHLKIERWNLGIILKADW